MQIISRVVNGCLLLGLLVGCRPQMPVTSSITIEVDGLTLPVNKRLYGLTLEEINHAIDGGLYAELIQNRSFEDGMPPFNCPYDPVRNMLTTPNGWSIPFMRADSVPGWHKLSANTQMYPDTKELVNDKNRRSMLVSIYASSDMGRGGIAAQGYGGIPIRKGETYRLSLYLKGAYMQPRTFRIALEDSVANTVLSDQYNVAPPSEWKHYTHTFTATRDANQAQLTFTADTAIMFWMDVVSLFPEKTWNSRANGLRPDLMEMIAALSPQFIRFPGGSFVEGYTAGTYPIWRETVGSIAERKNFWSVWAYGTTNGLGYHEYLQLCEDLKAEPVYVINSGVTSQSRRPRYEDITAMDKPVQDALDAIAYANEPTDSIFGAMRAKHGHPKPFNLRYIEIGSENYGTEYSKRYDLFKTAIKERYPYMTVISSSFTSRKNRGDWTDTHVYSGEDYFIANHNRYEQSLSQRRLPAVFVGEFGSTYGVARGTLRAAVSEACFLLGAESNPDVVKRLAYSPLLSNMNFPVQRSAAVSFDNHQAVASPAYYMLQMLWNNRGDEVLNTLVNTYQKPQVTFGRAGIELFDNSYDVTDVVLNGHSLTVIDVLSGGWKLESGNLI
ncbi:MAG: alpha-L-arabinofuranosidase C-terminal domain-containing protein, partial [Tannerellaceae bacterium]